MKHILAVIVENKPGVLNRIASLFRRRAYNIESLTVGHTERSDISRMTIVVDTDETTIHQVVANLYKMVSVLRVDNLTDKASVDRDLALVKVAVNSNSRSDLMQLVDLFRAHVVDVTSESLIIEITGSEEKIEGLIDVVRPFGIIEMVRTGIVSLGRGQQSVSKIPNGISASLADQNGQV